MVDKPAKEEALLADMAAWVKAHFPSVADSGIVYCLTRKVGAEVPAGERWRHGGAGMSRRSVAAG